jgi:predicted methyltransferase
VVEIWPGGGWYTELLAPLLRDNGKLYAAHFSATSDVAYFSKSRAAFDEKLAANPEIYDKVTVTTLMPPADMVIAPPASADVVVTFRSVHNWLRAANEQQILAAIYAALKPGGVLGVVEHRARPGTDEETMISSGYVTQARVKDMAKLAGFEFVASSEINANPRDSADHPKGVWTLPPSLRLGDQDREKYLAIGESDRMTLKFIKPLE